MGNYFLIVFMDDKESVELILVLYEFVKIKKVGRNV